MQYHSSLNPYFLAGAYSIHLRNFTWASPQGHESDLKEATLPYPKDVVFEVCVIKNQLDRNGLREALESSGFSLSMSHLNPNSLNMVYTYHKVVKGDPYSTREIPDVELFTLMETSNSLNFIYNHPGGCCGVKGLKPSTYLGNSALLRCEYQLKCLGEGVGISTLVPQDYIEYLEGLFSTFSHSLRKSGYDPLKIKISKGITLNNSNCVILTASNSRTDK